MFEPNAGIWNQESAQVQYAKYNLRQGFFLENFFNSDNFISFHCNISPQITHKKKKPQWIEKNQCSRSLIGKRVKG